MNSFANTSTNKTLHPVFTGLKEQQLATLYTEDRVKKLRAGDCLFSEGDADNKSYLLIAGEIQIQHNRDSMIYPITLIEYQGQISQDSFAINGK